MATPQQPHTPLKADSDGPKPLVWHDPWVYRLAVGGIGAALVAFLIGGCVIGASGHAQQMVKEYWTIGAALSGALVGIIAPSPRQKKEAARDYVASQDDLAGPPKEVAQIKAAPLFQPLLLIVALAVSLWLTSELNAADAAVLRTLAAGSAGALVGLLVPSPGANLKP